MAKTRLPEDVRAYFAKQGSKGGKIGGKKRMAALTPEERSELGKRAAAARKPRKKRATKQQPAVPKGTATKRS